MNTVEQIRAQFADSIQVTVNAADMLIPIIAEATEEIIQSLLEGHKILSCGNGSSACNAAHFSAKMLSRFKQERPSLPAITLAADVTTLTAIANDFHYSDIFAKQIRALGQAGDVFLAISVSGNSANVINAIKAAQEKNMTVIALTGFDGGKVAENLQEKDIEIRVPAYDAARIQELYLLIIHCICDIIDLRLFGSGENI